jgi:uncharacterized protein
MYNYDVDIDKHHIKIHQSKKLDLRNAIVFDGFPSVGLVSTIATNYLINVLELEQIGIIDSVAFPALSIIRNGEPLSPVRIYGGRKKVNGDSGETQNIVVFISEFAPPLNMIKPLAKLIVDFAVENDCHLIITPEGWAVGERTAPELPAGEDYEEVDSPLEQSAKVLHQALEGNGQATVDQPAGETQDFTQKKEKKTPVYGVGSTNYSHDILKKNSVIPFLNGAITGVSGVLLNEGKKRNRDVICLLAEAQQNFPDARAAASIVDAIDKIIFNIDIDPEPLFAEAEIIESQIIMMHNQVQTDGTANKPPKFMYG